MPIGRRLDQWEICMQFHGFAKPERERGIDEIIPSGIQLADNGIKPKAIIIKHCFLAGNMLCYIRCGGGV